MSDTENLRNEAAQESTQNDATAANTSAGQSQFAGQAPYGAPQQPYMGQPYYGAPQQPVYGAPPPPPYYGAPYPQPRKSNGIGTAGFIITLCAVVLCWVPFINGILGILGLVLSAIGVFRTPRGLAIAGLAISIVGLLVNIMAGGLLLLL